LGKLLKEEKIRMKKIINGKKYDTETAKELARRDNGFGCSEFDYVEETLYRKRTGEFFLYGTGGAASRYSTHCGNMWYGDERIMPLTEEEAKEWCEEYLDGDEYEGIFGEVEE
jgi:hypothetical protein